MGERSITLGGVAKSLGAPGQTSTSPGYQQALIEQQVRLLTAAMVEALPTAIWCVDLFGQIEIANPAARSVSSGLLTVDEQGFVRAVGGRPFGELTATAEPLAWEIVTGAKTYQLRSQVTELQGTSRVSVTATDVTRERAMLVRLADAERRVTVGVLGAGVAHEINNPLAFVSSNVRTLGEYLNEVLELLGDRKEVRAIRADVPVLLEETEGGLARIRKIVGELLQFSARDATPSPRTVVPLADIVDKALRLVGHELGKRGTIERVDVAASPVNVQVRELGDVVVDLLLNAFDAIETVSKERKVVTVRTRPGGKGTVLEIEDRGVGVPAQVLPHVFEPFFTTKGRACGTGLGLSVAAEIVRKHGGEITISSREGAGTVVIVELPEVVPELG